MCVSILGGGGGAKIEAARQPIAKNSKHSRSTQKRNGQRKQRNVALPIIAHFARD